MDWNNFEIGSMEAEGGEYKTVPEGEYELIIEELSDLFRTRTGGYACRLIYQIVEGEFKGRKIWDNCLNILKPDGKTPQFGVNTLNNIAKVRGLKPNYNPKDLVGYVFTGKVIVEKGEKAPPSYKHEFYPDREKLHYVIVSESQQQNWEAAKVGGASPLTPQLSDDDIPF